MLAKQSFVYKRPLASTNFKFKANYEIFNMPKVVIPTFIINELSGAKVWRRRTQATKSWRRWVPF